MLTGDELIPSAGREPSIYLIPECDTNEDVREVLRELCESLTEMLAMFPGLEASQLPGGEAWAIERLMVTTHSGTHVDAPWHFASTMKGGERAWTIDLIPLDWFYRPGVKLDFRDFSDGHVVTAAEVAGRIGATGHELKPLDIIVFCDSIDARMTATLTPDRHKARLLPAVCPTRD